MKNTYDAIMSDIQRTKEPDENTRQLVFTLSKIIDEEKMLQDIIDREGVTYQTTGDKGQTYIKSRPEYVELQRLRDKKRAYIAAIGITEGSNINTDFS
jgi:ubiquinone biosynthesis protein Coq4